MSDSDTTSTADDDGPAVGIGDDQLPEDLVPGEDNPLAEGLDDLETVDDLMEGKEAAESDSGDSGSDDDDS